MFTLSRDQACLAMAGGYSVCGDKSRWQEAYAEQLVGGWRLAATGMRAAEYGGRLKDSAR